MQPDHLASICHWGSRKPECHAALLKSGFIERFGKGFAVHEWSVYNAQLIQKWNAGKKGGRPANSETDRLAPVNRRQTGANRVGTDLIGLDRTGLRQSDKASAVVTEKSVRSPNPEAEPRQSDKAKKPQKGLTEKQKEIAERFEAALGVQWVNDAGKWINRIKAETPKSERVVAEVADATREDRINTTPAQYAEQIWKEFC